MVRREDVALVVGLAGVLSILLVPREFSELRVIGGLMAGLGLGAYLTIRPVETPRVRARR